MGSQESGVYIIYGICFLDLLVGGLTVPLMNLHLKNLNASHLTIGLLSSFCSLIQIFSGPLIGSWSDVRGRGSVLVVILSSCSIGYLLLGSTQSIVLMAAVRCVLGLFKHVQSLCRASIADVVSPDEQPGAYGKASAFGALGFLVGPSLGGHLYELPNGFALIGLLASLICLLSICLTLYVPSRGKEDANSEKPMLAVTTEFSKAISGIINLNWTTHWQSFLLKFLFGFTVNMYFENQIWYLKDRFSLSQRHVGYVLSFFNGIGTVSSFLLHKITSWFYKDDVNCTKRLLHFFYAISVSILMLYFSSNIQVFLIFLIPTAISAAILRIITTEYILKHSKACNRGSLSGASHSTVSLAKSFTPFVNGIINEYYGTQSALLVASIPPLIGTVLCYSVRSNARKLVERENIHLR